MKLIPLTNISRSAIVDDEDFEKLNAYKWRGEVSRRTIYACTGASMPPYNNHYFMHELLITKTLNLVIDHKDNNGLNNQKSNLRLATISQNKANGKAYSNNTSTFKGVTFRRERGTWRAQIRVNNKLHIIGCFHDKEDAARAYDKAALLYFGEFAKLNFS